MNFEPQWVDVDVKGEFTNKHYFGRFCLKPFLTNEERADAARLANMYCRGIDEPTIKMFLTTMAFLKFHITETDAAWWGETAGRSAHDEAPIWSLSEKLHEIQLLASGKKDPEKDKQKQ